MGESPLFDVPRASAHRSFWRIMAFGWIAALGDDRKRHRSVQQLKLLKWDTTSLFNFLMQVRTVATGNNKLDDRASQPQLSALNPTPRYDLH
jgi:hypothetical protein